MESKLGEVLLPFCSLEKISRTINEKVGLTSYFQKLNKRE